MTATEIIKVIGTGLLIKASLYLFSRSTKVVSIAYRERTVSIAAYS